MFGDASSKFVEKLVSIVKIFDASKVYKDTITKLTEDLQKIVKEEKLEKSVKLKKKHFEKTVIITY
jgi:hypothetical protein